MKRFSILLILLVLMFSVTYTVVLAQKSKSISMEARWKKVEELAAKQLPESALKELETILSQAKKDKNSPQIIKATVYKMRFLLEKNPDEAAGLIKTFETSIRESRDSVEKAVMHTMMAELYYKFYENDQYKINQRTEIEGLVPTDIREWTKNIFFNKILEQLNLSMSNINLLQKTESLKYGDILEPGDDSRTMQPTLYDFLSYRRIELLKNFADDELKIKAPEAFLEDALSVVPVLDSSEVVIPDEFNGVKHYILNTYNRIIDFNQAKNNIPAVVYAQLQKLSFEMPEQNEEYLTKLNALEKQYAGNEAVVEIIAAQSMYYQNKPEIPAEINDNKRKAYDIAAAGIRNYPNYKRIGMLRNIQENILQKNIQTTFNKAIKPQAVLKIKLTSQNLTALQLSVYKINGTAVEYYTYLQNRRTDKSLFPNRTLVETRAVNIKSDPNFEQVKSEIEIKTSDYGIYEFVLEEKGSKNVNEKAIGAFTVTDFAFIQRTNREKVSDIYVLDRIQGTPVKDVTLNTYDTKWDGNAYQINFQKKYQTDAYGYASLNVSVQDNDNLLIFEKGKDRYFTSQTYNSYWYRSSPNEKEQVQVALFTDRSLYRPGQLLYFKGIAYVSEKNKQEVATNRAFNVVLYNVNGEKLTQKAVKTNEFGSFAGEFVLPETGLNGAYRLECNGNSINVWVEEYKRPTFEVTVARPKTEVRFGEEVKVKGEVKAYAGYAIPDAQVKYRVVRRPHRFWWWHSEPEQIITSGKTVSNADGIFEVSFIPQKGKNKEIGWLRGNNDQFYTYTVYADVTDPKGETQQGEQTVSVGDKSLFILAEIADNIEKNKSLTLDVITQTLNGETVPSTVKYSVVKLQEPTTYYEELNDTTKLKELQTVLSGSFETKDKLVLDMKKLVSGMYKIVFTIKDNRGNEVRLEDRFVLYDNNDKRPAVKMYSWLQSAKTEVAVGETAQIKFGTSTRNTPVLYELIQGNTILEQRWIEFTDEIKTFDIPFKESYGGGVTAMFTFIKDEKFFTKSVNITRKVVEKKITPTLTVFRDKLQPGEKAEWTINIPQSADGKKAAELLIGMYDASLDALRPHSWSFNPTFREYVPYAPGWNNRGFEINNAYAWFEQKYNEVPDYQFDDFNWFGLEMGSRRYMYNRNIRIRGMGSVKAKEEVLMDASVDMMAASESQLNEVAVVGNGVMKRTSMTAAQAVATVTVEPKPVKVRENFNETAFFYPQLHTDSNGNVKVNFTAPESLTRWNVKMLAHTPDLYFGQEEAQVITQKDLMVQLNLPRFVRRSDKLTLAASVVNMTDKALTTTVKLQVINPENEKPVTLQSSEIQTITVEPKATKVVEWQFGELNDYDLVICKVTAQAGNFTDGEQKYLPVLPDKVLVTESQALTIRANQTRTFSFDSFISQLKNTDTKNFTVEFSSNPAWYAVQALPTLAEPTHENAIDYLTAYYANTLAGFIANSNPKLVATFERWKKAGGTRDALLSNLQKNQELKNMMLEETPWVTEAKDETEQKRQIALLFDLNNQKNQSEKYLDKLLKLQTPNGGFSWFEGMPESRYITQEILLNLARLNKMTKTIRIEKEQTAVVKALNYLDLEIARDYNQVKKYNKNYYKQNVTGNLQLFYLHMRSEYRDIPVDAKATDAVKFFTGQSEKYWTSWTLYGKAMMATVAHRNGNDLVAREILKSLKENAMKTDELGMYWAKNTAGWWWYERPIAVQTAMIEAFTEINNNAADADELKIWLLKNKQTQRWDTPISTVDAIYALLNYGSDWLSSEGKTTVMLGSTILKPKTTEAGTGYFKEEIPVATLKPEMGKITVENKGSNGIGWGAAYWQYFQDQDKIKSQGKEMNISKKLFVEKVENNRKAMLPIEQTVLKKGDKVITRLVLTTDRDLEFVALKDLRAACFEPVNQLSGCLWKEGVCYYQTTKDASTQFFFSFLPKGTYVFEYEIWVNNTGTFTSGITSVQCLYAPEFAAHTGGERLMVK